MTAELAAGMAQAQPRREPERLKARILPYEAMADRVAEWRELFWSADGANPFFGPDFLLPLRQLGGSVAQARLLVVEEQSGSACRLVALMPLSGFARLVPPLGAVIGPPAHPFLFDAMALIRAGDEAAAWGVMLDALALVHGRGILRIAPSPLDQPVVRGLFSVLAESGRASLVVRPSERAAVLRRGDAAGHRARIKPKVLAELRRCERNLTRLGSLSFRAAEQGPELAAAVDAFLDLEVRGWKGRQGTALASQERLATFARVALAGRPQAPAVRAEMLALDGRPLAVCLHLCGPGTAVAFKTAYDEGFARHAPGLLADLRTLDGVFAHAWTDRLDPGAPAGHAAGGIWRDRIASGEVFAALSPRQGFDEIALYARCDAMVIAARAALREAYYKVTGRKRTRIGRAGA